MGSSRRGENAAIELWLIGLEAAAPALEEMERTLPRLPAGNDTPASGSKRLSHIALRILLERTYGPGPVRRVPFVRSHMGKPALPGIPGEFSLAHTAEFALVGLNAGGPIGVDLEQPRQLSMSDARLEAIVSAASSLGGVAPTQAVPDPLQAWARLEALAKADGRGIGWALEALGGRPRAGQAPGLTAEGREALARLAVHDLAAGCNLFAAAAVPRALAMPALSHFPVSTPEILELLG